MQAVSFTDLTSSLRYQAASTYVTVRQTIRFNIADEDRIVHMDVAWGTIGDASQRLDLMDKSVQYAADLSKEPEGWKTNSSEHLIEPYLEAAKIVISV